MKNLKKLLAVVLAICVLATFTLPAFAAETKTPAEIATDLGVIVGSGSGVTAEYLATQPDRLQGAIMFLRLKGLESAAKAFIGTDNFADVDGLNETNKAILAYLKANPDLGFAGIGNNKFDPLNKMSAKEYYKVLLTALGYTYGTDATADFTWDTVFSFAASKGLVKLIDNEKFTVNDLCIGTVEALGTAVKGGTDTLIAKLVEDNSIPADKAIASGLYTAAATTLEVVSATADNLKTAKVVFNKELDKSTVVAANFGGYTPHLLSDGKTVVVVVPQQVQSSKLDIAISGVKSADGVKIADVTKTVSFVDTTIPVISGAIAKNAKTIVITANEPLLCETGIVTIWTDIKIDGNYMTADAVVDFAANTVTFNLTSLLAKGAHKIDISGLKDYANYVAVATSFNVEVAEDTTAPAITAAEMVNLNTVKVTFSEDLDTVGSFKVNGNTAVSATPVDSSKSVYNLTFTDSSTFGIGAIVEIKIEYKGQKDVVGNEVADYTTYSFKVADDTSLPTVTATLVDKNDLKLTFSKTMQKVGTVTVYKEDGTTKIVDLSLAGATWSDTDTVAKFSASLITDGTINLSATDAMKIVVKVADAKDATVRQNALVATTAELSAIDTKVPTVEAAYKITAGSTTDKDTVTFYFSEPMNVDTLKVLSNYYVDSSAKAGYTAGLPFSAISAISSPAVAADGKSVTFTAKGITTTGAITFKMYTLKDVAGNAISAVAGNVATTEATKDLAIASVAATGDKKIVVTYNKKVAAFDPSAYVVRTGNTTGSGVKSFINSFSIDGTKVTLNLASSIGTTPAGLYLVGQNLNLVKDIYGLGLNNAAANYQYETIADKVAPTATIESTVAGQIKITFSEDVVVDLAKLKNDLSIRKGSTLLTEGTDYTVTEAADVVTISGTEIKSGTEYTISILPRASVVDASANANKLGEISAAKVTVK